jgi:hypothetical protein
MHDIFLMSPFVVSLFPLTLLWIMFHLKYRMMVS